jgi:predicted permease
MAALFQDLRYALRSFGRSPGFTLVALATIAIGVGGATAIFSVVDGVVLRPLPYPDPGRILTVFRVTRNGDDGAFSPADFLDVQRDARQLTSLAGFREDTVDLTGHGEPVRIPAMQTTAAFFDVFGVVPVAGRTYSRSTHPLGTVVAVISEGFWRRQFGGRTDVIGTSVRINGKPTEIIGVAPDSFRHPLKVDAWMLSPEPVPVSPLPMEDGLADREVQYFGAVARLAPGATLAGARAELRQIGERMAQAFPETNGSESFDATPLAASLVEDVRTALFVLLGAVALVLLIACANVAGLLLARGTVRRRELAVRAALGAGRGRLVRQLVTESLMLALAGGAAGLLAGGWMQALLLAIAPRNIPRLDDIAVDWRVGAFAVAVTVVVGILFGLAPALNTSRLNLNDDLKDGGRTGTSARTRTRNALVVAEVALALVLLIGAGLMISSLMRMRAVDPGFRTSDLVAVQVPLPQARYDRAAQQRFYAGLLERLRAHPVTALSAIQFPIPLRGSNASAALEIEGREVPRTDQVIVEINSVSAGYFQTAGLRLLRGRDFSSRDGQTAPPVAIVNQTLVDREFAGRDPLGMRINLGSLFTIVGVVSNARRRSLDTPPQPAVYLPFEQFTLPFMGVSVRSAAGAPAVASAVKSAVASLDADLPIGEVLTIEAIIDESTGQPRFRTFLIASFSAVALLLAAVGLYGLIAFSVAQRVPEIGVRLAVGASPFQVGRLVIGQGLRLAAIGVAAGWLVAVPATRAVTGLLFETSATDPAIYAGLAALLLTVAAVACYVPARRAMRVDPIAALRAE